MSVEENLRVVDGVNKALNARDLDAFENFHLESVIQRDPLHVEPMKGRKAVRASIEPFIKAFPDIRVRGERQFGSGDWISFQGSIQGTHTGPFETPDGPAIPPTGKAIHVPFAIIAKLEVESSRKSTSTSTRWR